MENTNETESMQIRHISQTNSLHAEQDTETVEAKRLPVSFNQSEPDASALQIVYILRPEWRTSPGTVDIHRFTAGVMNTVCFLSAAHSAYASNAKNQSFSRLLKRFRDVLTMKVTRRLFC